jgi:hypothetical protein
MKKFLWLIAGALLIIVGIGWYCAENFGGSLGDRAIRAGECITWPGRAAEGVLAGNVHGYFGDWRHSVLEIGVSFFVWFSPAIIIAIAAARDRKAVGS